MALHALLLWWARGAPQAPGGAPRARLQWVEVEAPPAPAATPPAAAAPPARKGPARQASPTASAAAPASDAPARAGPAEAVFEGLGPKGDLPLARQLQLTPGAGAVLGMAPAADAEGPHGTTVRNGPGEAPDPVVAKEVEGERLSRTLNGQILDELGRAAVAVGTVPGHFRSAESAMRELFRKAPVEVTAPTSGDTVREVANLLMPGGISAEAARRVTDSPLGYSIATQSVASPTIDDSRFREGAMTLLGATEELKKRVQEPRLKAILELVTDPYGTVANAIVVQRSGDTKFDESVLHLSRKAFRRLPDNDEKALGSSWWKTKWQFTWAPPPFPGLQADVRVTLLDAHRIPPSAQEAGPVLR
jgi:hypothetical protein